MGAPAAWGDRVAPSPLESRQARSEPTGDLGRTSDGLPSIGDPSSRRPTARSRTTYGRDLRPLGARDGDQPDAEAPPVQVPRAPRPPSGSLRFRAGSLGSPGVRQRRARPAYGPRASQRTRWRACGSRPAQGPTSLRSPAARDRPRRLYQKRIRRRKRPGSVVRSRTPPPYRLPIQLAASTQHLNQCRGPPS